MERQRKRQNASEQNKNHTNFLAQRLPVALPWFRGHCRRSNLPLLVFHEIEAIFFEFVTPSVPEFGARQIVNCMCQQAQLTYEPKARLWSAARPRTLCPVSNPKS
jgi:hypothetical protein